MNRPSLLLNMALTCVVLFNASLGCGGPEETATTPDPVDTTDSSTGVEEVEDTWVPPTAWSDNVTRLILAGEQNSQEAEGTLADGVVIDPNWGHDPDVYCWVGPQGVLDFGGAHVFYAVEPLVPVNSVLEIELEPEEGLDLNLYAIAQPVGTYYVPPHVPSAIDCQNGDEEGAGGTETVEIATITEPYNLLVGVTGPEGTVDGGFTLRLTLQEN
ncbi:MAG: hypothetical protein VYE15_02265 [Myxococcota bacterium]|nr:hypothetical protein [Myxococcota bacterium]